MHARAAADTLLLRAFETRDGSGWSADDAAWASRAARDAAVGTVSHEQFIATRAHLALDRLAARDADVARWRARRGVPLAGLAVAIGVLTGLLADRIGSAQTINLLAPPVWALIGWNLLVYAWLGWHALRGGGVDGWLRRAATARLVRGRRAAAPWPAFAADWARHAAALHGARVATALHLAALALALGLVGGMYLRGLGLDYRVGWQSTFLDAEAVHALLCTALAPALALSPWALPDVAGIQALRLQPGAAPGASASAAPWLHVYALQLLLLVVVPRALLAAASAWRARRCARDIRLPLHEPYFQRLRPAPRDAAPLQVWPYALAPDARALDGLRRVAQRELGDGALQVEPMVPFGGEDDWHGPAAAGARAVALFDLAATPEAENHGRFITRLAAATGHAPLVLVDEGPFVRRFGAYAPRLQGRRDAWRALADGAGAQLLITDLHA